MQKKCLSAQFKATWFLATVLGMLSTVDMGPSLVPISLFVLWEALACCLPATTFSMSSRQCRLGILGNFSKPRNHSIFLQSDFLEPELIDLDAQWKYDFKFCRTENGLWFYGRLVMAQKNNVFWARREQRWCIQRPAQPLWFMPRVLQLRDSSEGESNSHRGFVPSLRPGSELGTCFMG